MATEAQELTASQRFEKAATDAGLTAAVGWLPNPGTSQEEWRNKAYRFEATISRDGKPVLTTPYYTGTGHTVGVSFKDATRADFAEAIRAAVRSGVKQNHPDKMGAYISPKMPTLSDVLGSLCMDDTGDSTFSEWAGDVGLSDDSISARADFDLIQENSAKLRRAVGYQAWRDLCELAREL